VDGPTKTIGAVNISGGAELATLFFGKVLLLKAIIFDFDGLMIETESAVFQAWREIYQHYGYELTFDQWQGAIGTQETTFDPQVDLEKRIGRPLNGDIIGLDRLAREYELAEQQPILPGVQKYLDHAQQLGLKLGLASSSYHEWVDYHLKQRGLYNYFETIQCADDVPLTKPDPALYLAAVEALGVSPREAFALEDSPPGAVAARRAGLFCVVVPNALTRQMTFPTIDLELPSLEAMPLTELLAVIQQRQGTNGKLSHRPG
jgi:HAD superfamily hydrolase (TIGR01509 family)